MSLAYFPISIKLLLKYNFNLQIRGKETLHFS